MIRLTLALTLLATPAAAMDLCVEVPAPAHKPIASKPRAITAVQVSRVYIVIRRATRASDVRLLCPVEQPAEIVPMVVVYGPESSGAQLPDFPAFSAVGNPTSEQNQQLVGDEPKAPNSPQLYADRSLYLGPAIEALTPSAIPEPDTWLFLLMGFLGLGAALRLQRKPA